MKTPAKTLLALLLGATVLAAAAPSFSQTTQPAQPPAAEQPADGPPADMAEEDGGGWGWWGHGKGRHSHGNGHGDGEGRGRGGYGEGRGGQGGRMMQIIDANADGVIGDDEAASRVEGVYYAMDADSSGDITEAEYMAVRIGPGEGRNKERQAMMQERKKARFVEMDADKDGKVTKEQFLAAGKARFLAADADKDGKVNPWEFRSQHMN
jgi:hypothetical protein